VTLASQRRCGGEQASAGAVYLASYYPTAEPGLTFAVIRLTRLNGVVNSRQ
jgi:hypothetical protein